MELIILGATFFGFLVIGVPVAFAIGLSAICTILYEGLPVAVIFQQMMSGMNIFSFLAIPFFVFSGDAIVTTYPPVPQSAYPELLRHADLDRRENAAELAARRPKLTDRLPKLPHRPRKG